MMRIKNWLTINNKGTARLTKNKPGLEWNEVTLQLNVEIPDSLFVRPQLSANIKIEGEFNHDYDYEMKSNIQDHIECLPNVHLLKINIEKIDKEKDE